MSKPKFDKFVSPKGVMSYPKLRTPDTKFKAEGEYAVKLIVPAAEAQTLIDKIDAQVAAAFEAEKKRLVADGKAGKAKALKLADKPYRAETDNDGNETGNVIFSFKAKASYVDKKTEEVKKLEAPRVFDAKGTLIPASINIWGGSVGKVSGEFIPFATAIGVGCGLRMGAVQVLELRSGGDRSASDYGFGEEEGYTADEAAAVPAETAATDDADDDSTPPNF